jgi:cell division protein FtsN
VAVLVVAIAGLLLPRALRLGAHDTPAMRAGSIPVADSLSAVTRTAEEPPKAKRSPAKPKADSTATRRRYAIRVATYLDRERAEEERDRIARTTGLHTRIWDASDGGAVHHIVVGAFDDADEAERSADGLLQRGLVQEARVVGYRSSARRRDR